MPQISVTASGADRETPTEKISRCVEHDQRVQEASRLRIPVMIYDRATTSYKHIPDAAWTVVLEGMGTEQIEDFVRQLGERIAALAQELTAAAAAGAPAREA